MQAMMESLQTHLSQYGASATVLVLLVGTAILWALGSVVYNLYFSPLAKYPGPLLWRCSRFFFCRSLTKGNLVHDTKRFHDRYGKIVRLAPNELSFIDGSAWRDIHGHRVAKEHFIKNPVWTSKSPNGVYPIIDAPQKDHDRQRKILNYGFSAKALKSQEPILQQYTNILIDKLGANGVSNMKDWFQYVAFDITGDLTFGQSFNCMTSGASHEWVANLFSHTGNAVLLASVKFYPFLFNILLKFIPKKTFEQREYQFGKTVHWVHKRLDMKSERPDFMSYIQAANAADETNEAMTLKEIEASASVLVVAGSETTATALVATLKSLMQRPEKLQKLVDEVRGAFTNDADITIAALEQGLPYLKAVILENLRYNPPVPTQIPTVIGEGGAHVCGEFFPEGTCVGLPQFAAYRSELNFAFPADYIPERWLPVGSPLFAPTSGDPYFDRASFASDKVGVLQPFSVGPRNCIGQYLAHAEMRLILAKVLYHFDPVFPDDMPLEERMEPFDNQITLGLWVKKPFRVQMVPVKRVEKNKSSSHVVEHT